MFDYYSDIIVRRKCKNNYINTKEIGYVIF